jgi:hypothetical protein
MPEARTGGTNWIVAGVISMLAVAGILTLKINSYVDYKEVSAPAAPASGFVRNYAKSDHKIYRKQSDGTEVELGGGGGTSSTNVVYVNAQATAGAGTSGSPWTGWDTAITWSANTEYYFPNGYYSYATSPNFCKAGLSLVGESQTGTVLKYTGAGVAVNFTAPAASWVFSMNMENFTIQGTPASSDQGMVLSGVRGSTFRNITIRDFITDGLYSEACVTNIFDNLYIPRKSYVTTQPKNGVRLNARAGDGAQTTTWLFNNLIVEGASEKGIYIKNAFWNVFQSGTVEGIDGKGLVIDSNGAGVTNDGNTFVNIDFESNNQVVAAPDVEIRGNRQHFIQCNCSGDELRIYAGKGHQLNGGNFHDLTFDAGLTGCSLFNLSFTGTLTGLANVAAIGAVDESGTGLPVKFTVPANSPVWAEVSIDGSNLVATNANIGNFFLLLANHDFTLSNPTNPTLGQRVTWRIMQDVTGSRLITLGSKFKAGPFTITLSTAANKIDYLEAVYNSTNDSWDIVNFVKGY